MPKYSLTPCAKRAWQSEIGYYVWRSPPGAANLHWAPCGAPTTAVGHYPEVLTDTRYDRNQRQTRPSAEIADSAEFGPKPSSVRSRARQYGTKDRVCIIGE
jgi:hypothetical protein